MARFLSLRRAVPRCLQSFPFVQCDRCATSQLDLPTWEAPAAVAPTFRESRHSFRHMTSLGGRYGSLQPVRGLAGLENSETGSPAVLDDVNYHSIADETLESMLTNLEVFVEAIDLDDADVECGQGVLTLKLGKKGTFVINKQSPNKQIWLSSPISGPFRYDYLNGHWTYSRDGHLLKQKLEKELEELCGKAIVL